MTANQIAYVNYLEKERNDRELETIRRGELAEQERANRQREYETNRANTLNYNASIYASQASMYNAQLQAQTQRYNTDTQARVKREEIQQTRTRDTLNYTTEQSKLALQQQQFQFEQQKWDEGGRPKSNSEVIRNYVESATAVVKSWFGK